MSYCRFSSDDFQCDLYVYESASGGFCTVVAKSRAVFPEPLPAPLPTTTDDVSVWKDRWLARHRTVMVLLDRAARVPIELPHAGEQFYDDTLDELLERLMRLKELGYRYPVSVEAMILDELNSLSMNADSL